MIDERFEYSNDDYDEAEDENENEEKDEDEEKSDNGHEDSNNDDQGIDSEHTTDDSNRTVFKLEDVSKSPALRDRLCHFIHQIQVRGTVTAPIEIVVLRSVSPESADVERRQMIEELYEFNQLVYYQEAGISFPAVLARDAADVITSETAKALEPGFKFQERPDADGQVEIVDGPLAIDQDTWAKGWVAG